MDSWISPVCEKDSPSQENIAHPQLIKRDGESLEDFEDITKDEPSVKDVTAQFLQFETGAVTEQGEKESDIQDDVHYDFEEKSSSDFLDMCSDNDVKTSKSSLMFEPSVEPKASVYDDPFDLPKTNTKPKFDGILEPDVGNSVLNILDQNKLLAAVSNDEISTGSDDLSFIPKKEDSSPAFYPERERDVSRKLTSDHKPTEASDYSFNAQPLSKFTSKSGMYSEEEPVVMEGDILRGKKTIEDEVLENDDFVPEPIPKDYPEIGALEGKQFLAAMGIGSWFRPDLLHPKVESLVYWRDPKKSGIVFGGVLTILLSLTSFSLISVVAYTSLIALVSALAFRIYKSVMQAIQKTSEGHPFKEYLDIDLTVNPEKAREIADVAVMYINKTLTEVRRLFLIEDVIDSIKFGVLLWSLTYIGAWFNGLSLLIIAFVGLFTLPKVYENNKTQIDANIDFVKTKVNEFTEKITAVIPLGKRTEEVKDKGE